MTKRIDLAYTHFLNAAKHLGYSGTVGFTRQIGGGQEPVTVVVHNKEFYIRQGNSYGLYAGNVNDPWLLKSRLSDIKNGYIRIPKKESNSFHINRDGEEGFKYVEQVIGNNSKLFQDNPYCNGVGISKDEHGYSITVLFSKPLDNAKNIPHEIEGVPVFVNHVGEIVAA